MKPDAGRRQVQVSLGKAGLPLGTMVYARQGRREHVAFAYEPSWLQSKARFNVSADLQLVAGYQSHKAASAHDSVFHGAIADTTPDAWGRRVIARDHAKRRKQAPDLGPLTELDYLLAVDDFSRVGALRLRAADSNDPNWSRTVAEGERSTPPLIELRRIYHATHAVERGQETQEDLRYLQGRGTSLGGMRPKCTVIDTDGRLAIGKFPSVQDARSVTRGEVLALKLAEMAGIDAAPARVVSLDDVPVALIKRFDRDDEGGRLAYQSASSVLQASREEDRSYTEIADAIRSVGADPIRDLRQLWRRLVFNLLITNVDDHLQNHGFLHLANGQWRLAPAFDLNPFPDKDRESKTWLSEQHGPITDVAMLLDLSAYFALERDQALQVVREVRDAVLQWKQLALSPVIGMQAGDLDDFAPAFEHEQMRACDAL